MTEPERLLVLGFDAAAGELARRWADAGELPVLARLIADGATAPLGSLAEFLPESIWSSIITGCEPGGHGTYNWRETEGYIRARRSTLPERPPFWELVAGPAGAAPRALLFDVHGGVPSGDDRVRALHGWGVRGTPVHERTSWPTAEMERVIAAHGDYARNLNRELGGRPLVEHMRVRTLERMAARRAAILADLMSAHPWEICATTFSEAHHAGHAFHRYAERDAYLEPVPRGRGLDDALLRVYRAVDTAMGRLVEAAPRGTHVAVISGMGMRPNTNGLTLLPRALEALGYTVPAEPSGAARRRERLRRIALTAVPRPLARAVRRRMLDPAAIEAHAAQLWVESTDWQRTRAWAEAEQGSGWIKLNVAGREPDGIVQPGGEYDDLCAEIAADLLELREAETGQPAIDAVVHRSEVTSGPFERHLPDLLVKWSDKVVVRRARHPRTGIVEDDGSDWQVSEHDDDGWLVLAGPRVRAGAGVAAARVEDVAPTLVQLMGGTAPADLDGRVLTELLEPAGEAEAVA